MWNTLSHLPRPRPCRQAASWWLFPLAEFFSSYSFWDFRLKTSVIEIGLTASTLVTTRKENLKFVCFILTCVRFGLRLPEIESLCFSLYIVLSSVVFYLFTNCHLICFIIFYYFQIRVTSIMSVRRKDWKYTYEIITRLGDTVMNPVCRGRIILSLKAAALK